MASNTKASASVDRTVYDVICAAGPEGITGRQLGRLTQCKMATRQRREALQRLSERGHIACLKRPSRTKPTNIYCVAGGQSCGTCRFWMGGKCKRYPPVPYWPKMGADEWCGEYQVVGLSRQDG